MFVPVDSGIIAYFDGHKVDMSIAKTAPRNIQTLMRDVALFIVNDEPENHLESEIFGIKLEELKLRLPMQYFSTYDNRFIL